MKIAKDFITEKQKPPKTKIHRIPEETEDALFKSYFENFYPAVILDFNTSGTTASQDIDKIAKQ